MQIGLVALEFSAANLTKRDARAVVGVDVGGDFEDEAREFCLVGLHFALFGLRRTRRGCNFDKTIQQFLNTEIVERRTEKHGRNLGRAVGLDLKFGIDAVDEFKVVAQLRRVLFADSCVQFVAGDVDFDFFRNSLFVRRKQVEFLLVNIVNALEFRTLIDGPRQRSDADFQFLFEFVEQVERVATFAVHLVDEDDDGRVSHSTNLHQFARLRFDTFRAIDHDNGRIHGGQRAVGVFGEVLVTGRVEDVHLVVAVVKLHHRRRNRNTALLLDVHPVRRRCFPDFIAFHGSSHLNLAAEEQKFLRQRGFTGVGVADDGESSPAFYFWVHFLFFNYWI